MCDVRQVPEGWPAPGSVAAEDRRVQRDRRYRHLLDQEGEGAPRDRHVHQVLSTGRGGKYEVGGSGAKVSRVLDEHFWKANPHQI